MFDITAMVQSIANMVKSVLDLGKSKVENAPTVEVITDKHRQEKAIYHAEKAKKLCIIFLPHPPRL